MRNLCFSRVSPVSRRMGLAFDMKKVKVPALVLEGETHVLLSEAREWVKSLPDARFLLISDAGHAIFIDQPEAVIAAMDEFFRGNWPAGAK